MSVITNPASRPFMEREKNKFIDFWKMIVELESPTNDKALVDKVGQYVADFALSLGFSVRRVPFAKSADGIVIEWKNGSDKAPILFGAHLDTVHPVGAFGTPTVKVDGDNMIGPGILDDKAGIVQGLLTMAALREIGYKDHPLKLVLSPDEEVSTVLSGKEGVEYLEREGRESFCAFNLECGYPDKFTVSRFGILRRKFKVHGVAAHAGGAYDKGRSAIREMAYKIIELEKQSDLEHLTFNCGVISGGTVSNVVPEFCEVAIDMRFIDKEYLEKAREITDRVAAMQFVPDTTTEVEEIAVRPAMPFTEGVQKLAILFNECHEALEGKKLEYYHTRGGSDAAFFAQIGVPTIDSIGPLGGNIHNRGEWADTSTLVPRCELLVTSILNLPEKF